MKLTKQVAVDLMAAMKNQDKGKLDALRSLKTAFILAKTETGATDLADEDELKIVQKLIKQRKDSAAEYKANNRADLAEKELSEAEVLSAYCKFAYCLSAYYLSVHCKSVCCLSVF